MTGMIDTKECVRYLCAHDTRYTNTKGLSLYFSHGIMGWNFITIHLTTSGFWFFKRRVKVGDIVMPRKYGHKPWFNVDRGFKKLQPDIENLFNLAIKEAKAILQERADERARNNKTLEQKQEELTERYFNGVL